MKQFVQLRTDRKARYTQKLIPLFGIKQVTEAPQITTLVVETGAQPPFETPTYYQVSREILKKISGQPHPEPVAALTAMPPFVELSTKQAVIALDGVSDPGNVGTLIRTGAGLGWEGCFLTQTCADPFNHRALRAAMGATLHLPLQMGTDEELLRLAQNFSPIVANLVGIPLTQFTSPPKPLLVLGSEASGVSPAIAKAFPNVTIPIAAIESLNVAAAGAIFMYALRAC